MLLLLSLALSLHSCHLGVRGGPLSRDCSLRPGLDVRNGPLGRQLNPGSSGPLSRDCSLSSGLHGIDYSLGRCFSPSDSGVCLKPAFQNLLAHLARLRREDLPGLVLGVLDDLNSFRLNLLGV